MFGGLCEECCGGENDWFGFGVFVCLIVKIKKLKIL